MSWGSAPNKQKTHPLKHREQTRSTRQIAFHAATVLASKGPPTIDCTGGAPGSGAPSGPRNGNYRYGRRTTEAIAERRQFMAFIRQARKLAIALTGD
jgi:hypothetical protein